MNIRKDIYSLAPAELKVFIDGLLELKQSGVYDHFVQVHLQAMDTPTPFGNETPDTMVRNAAHRGPGFLPWHREYLRRFEIELQKGKQAQSRKPSANAIENR